MTVVELAGGSPESHLEKLVNDEATAREIAFQFAPVPETDLAQCEAKIVRHKEGKPYVARTSCTDQHLTVRLIQLMEFQDHESIIDWPEQRRESSDMQRCCGYCGDIVADGYPCVCLSFPGNQLSLELRLSDDIAYKMNDNNALKSLLRACRITYAYICIEYHNGLSSTGHIRKAFDAIDINNRQTWYAYSQAIKGYLTFHCHMALEEVMQFASEAKVFV